MKLRNHHVFWAVSFSINSVSYTYLISFVLQTKTVGWKKCFSEVIQFKHQQKSLRFRCIN